MYPVLGALRMSCAAQRSPHEPLPYVLYQRREGVMSDGVHEQYEPCAMTLDEPPTREVISKLIPKAVGDLLR